MGMGVAIASELLRQLADAASASAEEVCGLLFGTLEAGVSAQTCRNVAADPRRRFEIDPAALLAAHRAQRAGGPAIVGCYHSHPRGDPTPSPRDAADAAANGWLWLILGAGEARLFRAVEGGAIHGRFEEVALLPSPPRP
jgi:desampylase